MANSEHKLFYSNFMKSVQDLVPKPPSVVNLPESPKRISELLPTIQTLVANVQFLVGENAQQKDTINSLLFENSKLKSELDALDQYSRRENVCFTNVER